MIGCAAIELLLVQRGSHPTLAIIGGLIILGFGAVSLSLHQRIGGIRHNHVSQARCTLPQIDIRTDAIGNKRNRRLARLQRMTAEASIASCSPVTFERFVLDFFRVWGFSARATERNADGGVDGILERPGTRAILQCKRQSRAVGEPVVRDLLGVLTKHGFNQAFLVTTATFTTPARRFADGTAITLIDGAALDQLIRETPYLDPRTRDPIALSWMDFSTRIPA